MSKEASPSAPEAPVPAAPVPEAKEGKSEDIFEVERILAHKISGKDFLLKVRWLGYGPNDDTWEPELDIRECAGEVVQEYYARMKVNDKTELIEALQRNISRSSSKKKAEKKRKMESDTESDGAVSDDSSAGTSSKKSSKKSKKRRSSTSDSSPKKSKVPTKAALKSYSGESSAPVPPNNAKKAAFEIRDQRNHWLEEESSDDEPNAPTETEIEKIAKKVRDRGALNSPKPPPFLPSGIKVPKSPTPGDQPCSSSSLATSASSSSNPTPPEIPLSTSAQPPAQPAQPKLIIKVPPPNVACRSRPSTSDQDNQESDWIVEGIARHTDEMNVRKKVILMANKKTGERKVLDSREAFELDAWALTKYLLDRCEF